MKRRDLAWIAAIWIVLLLLAVTVAAFFSDDDPTTNDALAVGILAAIFGVVATGFYLYVRRQRWARRDVVWIAAICLVIGALAVPVGVATGDSAGAGQTAGVVIVAAASLYWYARKR